MLKLKKVSMWILSLLVAASLCLCAVFSLNTAFAALTTEDLNGWVFSSSHVVKDPKINGDNMTEVTLVSGGPGYNTRDLMPLINADKPIKFTIDNTKSGDEGGYMGVVIFDSDLSTAIGGFGFNNGSAVLGLITNGTWQLHVGGERAQGIVNPPSTGIISVEIRIGETSADSYINMNGVKLQGEAGGNLLSNLSKSTFQSGTAYLGLIGVNTNSTVAVSAINAPSVTSISGNESVDIKNPAANLVAVIDGLEGEVALSYSSKSGEANVDKKYYTYDAETKTLTVLKSFYTDMQETIGEKLTFYATANGAKAVIGVTIKLDYDVNGWYKVEDTTNIVPTSTSMTEYDNYSRMQLNHTGKTFNKTPLDLNEVIYIPFRFESAASWVCLSVITEELFASDYTTINENSKAPIKLLMYDNSIEFQAGGKLADGESAVKYFKGNAVSFKIDMQNETSLDLIDAITETVVTEGYTFTNNTLTLEPKLFENKQGTQKYFIETPNGFLPIYVITTAFENGYNDSFTNSSVENGTLKVNGQSDVNFENIFNFANAAEYKLNITSVSGYYKNGQASGETNAYLGFIFKSVTSGYEVRFLIRANADEQTTSMKNKTYVELSLYSASGEKIGATMSSTFKTLTVGTHALKFVIEDDLFKVYFNDEPDISVSISGIDFSAALMNVTTTADIATAKMGYELSLNSSALNLAISDAEKVDQKLYTAESLTAFNNALKSAKELNVFAGEKEINTKISELTAAKNALVEQGNTSSTAKKGCGAVSINIAGAISVILVAASFVFRKRR